MTDVSSAASGATSPRQSTFASISVVLPAYNEAGNLPSTLADLTAQLPSMSPHWEVVVVDDGSRDETALVMQPWVRQYGVRYVQLSRNFGKEAALSAGIDHAHGDVVILMDADGQHPVDLLPDLLTAWREGADMVCAVRASRDDESWSKRLGTALFYRIVNAGSKVTIPENASDFRLMDRAVVEALRSLPERNRFMKGLYAWVGFQNRLIPYTPLERRSGRSSFSLIPLVRLAITGLTSFSSFPLRVWGGVGSAIAALALLYGVWLLIEHFVGGHPLPGWSTLAVSLMFFSGVQLLSIGVLGEYIGRIFNEVKRRPLYIVGSETGRGLTPREQA